MIGLPQKNTVCLVLILYCMCVFCQIFMFHILFFLFPMFVLYHKCFSGNIGSMAINGSLMHNIAGTDHPHSYING